MAMGREGEVQGDLMVTWAEMPRSPGHVFYDGLQKLLADAGFDAFLEEMCKPFYAPRMGAPSMPPPICVGRMQDIRVTKSDGNVTVSVSGGAGP